MGLLLITPVLFAEEAQLPEIDTELLEFLGAWESEDEHWAVILDEQLWQENEVKEGAGDD